MENFSICIIAKNEEKNLLKLLPQLTDFDCEIIVVDTGSSDNTVSVANKYATKVLSFQWINDFSAARNYSISQATHDWILVLDCDEFIDNATPTDFMALAQEHPESVGLLKRINLSNPDNQKGAYTDFVPRFFNRNFFYYEGAIHEQVRSYSPDTMQGFYLPLTVLHTGYIGTPEQKKAKHLRNLTMLQQELEVTPDNPYIHFQIGNEYYNQRSWESALPHLRYVLEQELHPQIEYHRLSVMAYGDCLLHLNRLSEAEQMADYSSLFGYSPDFHCLMGMIYYAANNPLKSMMEFIVATSMDNPFKEGTNTYIPWYYMARINESLGQMDEANLFYSKCKEYLPEIKTYID